jgi:hypothetical protein
MQWPEVIDFWGAYCDRAEVRNEKFFVDRVVPSEDLRFVVQNETSLKWYCLKVRTTGGPPKKFLLDTCEGLESKEELYVMVAVQWM